MTIQRQPHPVFSALWGVWTVALVWVTVQPSQDARLWLWAAFLLVEIPAALWNTGMRKTLSEIATWLHRKWVKGPAARIPWRGWNALLFSPVILLVGWNVGHTIAHGGSLPQAILGVLVGGLMAVGLWDHWVSPDANG